MAGSGTRNCLGALHTNQRTAGWHQNVGFSHHGFSMVFWALSGLMFARGLCGSFFDP